MLYWDVEATIACLVPEPPEAQLWGLEEPGENLLAAVGGASGGSWRRCGGGRRSAAARARWSRTCTRIEERAAAALECRIRCRESQRG